MRLLPKPSMLGHALLRRALAFCLAAAAVAAASADPQPAPQVPQAPPVFRGSTSLVPVDVRVTDRQGKPVADLSQNDFVILENGVRQQIKHFSVHALTPEPPADGVGPRLPRGGVPAPLGRQNARIFLIVLGRGRLQPPARGVDGMLHFVRERLLPQDQVAVLAWNRATDFTVNHDQVADMLERFKKRHEAIESALAMHFSGLAAIYGSREMPARIQEDIDMVFAGPGGTKVNTVIDAPIANPARLADDQRRATDAVQRAEIVATRSPDSAMITDAVDPVELLGLKMSLDELAALNAQSTQDLSKIYTGLQYLRYLDGEKHLIFVSPSGVFLPRADDDRSLASIAADARVAISIVHTGGVGSGDSTDWRRMTSRTAAEETGGIYSSTSYAKDFVNRLDDVTRNGYVLGYYPTNATLDRRYRQITVRVNRPGVNVLFRHGYFARTELPPLDRKRMLSYNRVTTAASFAKEVPDIAIAATAVNATSADKTREAHVEVHIAPDRLTFSEANGMKLGTIEIAVFCADANQRLVGQSWNSVDLKMTADAFARFTSQGLTYRERIAVRAQVRHIKIVVYDVGADVLGSAMVKVK
ncbi:MAG TPA: VWA domain-containing protein [Vicinamibacterales bacterium]|nr:VWA domain-containing protein [Vicinamibacterales bacterium]